MNVKKLVIREVIPKRTPENSLKNMKTEELLTKRINAPQIRGNRNKKKFRTPRGKFEVKL